MANKSFKTLTFGIIALSAAFFVGCMGNDAQSAQEYGTLSIKVGTSDVNAASKSGLSKGSTIALSKLIITMISNASTPDTVRDTIRANVSQGFKDSSTINQTIDSVYVLKALRTWYITAKTLDTRDSVVHIKQDTIVKLLAGQSVTKNLTLNPRFVMYTATFNFPDSLGTSSGTGIKQKMNITRLIMQVGNDTVVNQATAYAPSTNYTIGFDYVPVLTGTTVKLYVIGNLVGSSIPGDSVLYRKIDISVAGQAAGATGSQTATLDYVGPVTGKETLTVSINKVGLYSITAQTPQNVVPKTGSK